MRHWLWRLLSRPEYFPPVPPHEFTPFLHHDGPCVYCGKIWCGDEGEPENEPAGSSSQERGTP